MILAVLSSRSEAAIAYNCQVSNPYLNKDRAISSIKIEPEMHSLATLHLVSQKKGSNEVENVKIRGKLKEGGGVIAFVGESNLGRASMMLAKKRGTIAIGPQSYKISCE